MSKGLCLGCYLVVVLTACVTFRPADAAQSILPMVSEGGACTAWAVGPDRWMTAKHCLMVYPGPWRIAGVLADPVAIDPDADLALVTGPGAPPIAVATDAPRMGATVTTWGYGLSTKPLLVFSALVVSVDAEFFTDSPHEFIVSGANGMPGMSGGPILYRGKAVSQISGGGPAPSHAHLVGSGVSFAALSAFAKRHVGKQ